jgi:hypothetical protein
MNHRSPRPRRITHAPYEQLKAYLRSQGYKSVIQRTWTPKPFGCTACGKSPAEVVGLWVPNQQWNKLLGGTKTVAIVYLYPGCVSCTTDYGSTRAEENIIAGLGLGTSN